MLWKESQFHFLSDLAVNGYLVVRLTVDIKVICAHWPSGRLGPVASLKSLSKREGLLRCQEIERWSCTQFTRSWQIVCKLVSGESYCIVGLLCNQLQLTLSGADFRKQTPKIIILCKPEVWLWLCFVIFWHVVPYSLVNNYKPFGGTWCLSGFGGLEVACWPLVPKFADSNPAEAVGFFRAKKSPQHAFLRKGIKAICPMS